MKKSLIILLAVALVMSASAGVTLAGVWNDEVPVTQDTMYQYYHYVAAAPDDTLYVLWPDWRDFEDTQVILERSTDRGQTWAESATIFSGAAYDRFDLLADAAGLHLLLIEYIEDDEAEYKMLYYTFSADGGDTFSEPIRVGTRDSIEDIQLCTYNGGLYVYVQDYDFDEEITYHYLHTSCDGGLNWTENQIMVDYVIRNPDFTVDGNGVHMVFASMPDEEDVEIKYARSTDLGLHWTTPVSVSQGAGAYSQLPCIVIDGGLIHVAWEDNREGYYNIMYAHSDDGGATWSGDVRINDTFYGARAQLLADEEGMHVLWSQYHGDDGWPASWFSGDYGIIWYKSSIDGGLTWSDEFRVSQNEDILPIDLPSQGANHVRLAEFETGFCAVWQDKRDGNIDLYLRDYTGPGCLGDLDGDGDTDLSDLAALLAAYGTVTGDPNFLPEADFDYSGVIDLSDLAFLLSDYGC